MKDIKNDYDNGLNIAVCSTRKDYTDYLKAYIFQNKITGCSDYIDNLLLDNDYTIYTFKSLLKPHLQPVKYKVYNNDKIIDDVQTYLDTLSFTYFHGDLTTSHKQKILENKETEIYKDLLIYTPAIQSGVDFSICHYDKIYFFADSCSISIQNQVQLFRRVRHLTLENVNIYIPPFNSQCMTKKPTTFQNKKYELKKQVNELSSIEDIVHKTLIESSDNISFLNDNQTIMKELNEECFLTKQFIQKNVEQTNMKRYFYLLFLHYLYKFVNDDSKISFKFFPKVLTEQDIQDTDLLKEHMKKIKQTKHKLTLDIRQGAIEFLKQKADIDNILKLLEDTEEKGIDDKQLITSLYASKHIRQDKIDDLNTDRLKFVEDNNKIIQNYRSILQNNLVDTYKKDLEKINMSKEEKLEMFKRKDNKVFNHYLLLELLKIIGIDFDVSKYPNDDVLILSDNKNTWINERTYNFINLIQDWNVSDLPYEELSNFFNKYIATFNCGKSVHTNQHITKRLSSILKTYLGITLDIDRSRKQVNNERKCVFNYTMIFADGLLDIFDKIKVAP